MFKTIFHIKISNKKAPTHQIAQLLPNLKYAKLQQTPTHLVGAKIIQKLTHTHTYNTEQIFMGIICRFFLYNFLLNFFFFISIQAKYITYV